MTSETVKPNKTVEWLEGVLSNLSIDKDTIELGVASPETVHHYNRLAEGEAEKMILEYSDTLKVRQLPSLLEDYLSYFIDYPENPFITFALRAEPGNTSFWVEVQEYSEEIERDIIMADAKINAKYESFGVHTHTMMVESCDNLPVPPSYRVLASSKED